MMRATILGCGSSGGVPRFGGENGAGEWGDCDPNNPKNHRQRCSLLLTKTSEHGSTKICIDAGPDFRAQMLQAQVEMLDALVLTHEHADHIHGIDDMRQFVNIKTYQQVEILKQNPAFEMTKERYFELVENARIDCFAGLSCYHQMNTKFDYLFNHFDSSLYPPIMRLKQIESEFTIKGKGGDVSFKPFAVPHGEIDAFGFKINDLVYLPDVQTLNDTARSSIANCQVLIIDCLQFRTHGTHCSFEDVMRWVDELKPKKTILTDMHYSLDYDKLNAITPDHVTPAFDGMEIEFD